MALKQSISVGRSEHSHHNPYHYGFETGSRLHSKSSPFMGGARSGGYVAPVAGHTGPSQTMTSRVYKLHSTLELPLEDVYEFFDDPDLPERVADVDITRRNNTLILSAVSADDSISKYTPTAQLKASVTENRVYEEEPETGPGKPPRGSGGPQWGAFEEEEEIESELVEYACFKGDRETVLQNTALQYQMFQVLCEIAVRSEKGTLTAVAADEEEIEAVRIVDGERRPASVTVTEDPGEDQAGDGIDWRSNEFISD